MKNLKVRFYINEENIITISRFYTFNKDVTHVCAVKKVVEKTVTEKQEALEYEWYVSMLLIQSHIFKSMIFSGGNDLDISAVYSTNNNFVNW